VLSALNGEVSIVGIIARQDTGRMVLSLLGGRYHGGDPRDGRTANGGMISAFISVIFILIVILLVGGVLVAALVSVAESLPQRRPADPVGRDRKH
jgi:hypothetical protein